MVRNIIEAIGADSLLATAWSPKPNIKRGRRLSLVVVCVIAATTMAFGAPASFAAPKPKVRVCHIPPGDPANFHTITISENALPGHLAHGDLMGSCNQSLDALCDDGNPCTVDVDATAETCTDDPRPAVDCEDGNLCTLNTCNQESGGCTDLPKDCSDDNKCTVDVCLEETGECQHALIACEEGSFCDPETGFCGGNPCDTVMCTMVGECQAGACTVIEDEQGQLQAECWPGELLSGTPCEGGTCDSGECVQTCDVGFADCDGQSENGCETNITSSVDDCGGCGLACTNPNGIATCGAGVCTLTCTVGFADCDGQSENGCETNITSSVDDCGGCGLTCTNPNGIATCGNGVCTPTCTVGFANCDGQSENGCETDITSSVAHCGGCDNACDSGQECSFGTCQ